MNYVIEQSCYLMRGGTIVDATMINAPGSTKNAEKSRDPEMHQTKKGNEWRLGMNIQPVLEAAHKEQTTLTVYLCACLMDAISETVPVRAKKRPVVLSVPVNLRSHFPSASARNFFSVLFVGYDYGKRSAAFGDVVKKIGSDLSSGLALDNLSRGIDAYSAMMFRNETERATDCLGYRRDCSSISGDIIAEA